jgi:hypothetical protein
MALGAALARLEPSLLEEGAHLHIAQRLADGERLYRDVVFFTGPLPFELLALLFRVFGDEVFVARGAVVLLQGLGTAASFAIARRAQAGPLAHAAAAVFAASPAFGFPTLSIYFYTTIAFYLVPLSVYAGLRAPSSPRWAFGAGVLIACVALCKQTLGLALAASLGAAILWSCPRGMRIAALGPLALGAAAMASLTTGWYAAVGGLGDVIRATVVMPLSLSGFSLSFPNFLPFGKFEDPIAQSASLYIPNLYFLLSPWLHAVYPAWLVGGTQLLFALPFAALAATGLASAYRTLPPAVWLHGAALLVLTTNLYPRADWGHLVFVLPAAWVHLHLIWPKLDSNRPARTGRGRRALAVCSLTLSGVVALVGCFELYRRSAPPNLGPRVPLRPVSWSLKAPSVSRVVAYIRARAEPNEAIFVARQEPLIYFATDTRNPTPYVGAISGYRVEQELTIIPALEDVRYVVMSEIDQPGYHFYSEEFPNIQARLERFFRIPSDIRVDPLEWLQVLEPVEDRGELVVDLLKLYEQRKASVRSWERGRDGEERSRGSERMSIPTQQHRRLLPIRLGMRGAGVDFRLGELAEGIVFQADVGLRVIRTASGPVPHPSATHMIVAVRSDGEFETLHRARILNSPLAGGRWRPLEVDLSAYAGQNVTLRLEVLGESAGQAGRLAWWGSPRLARRTTEPR